VLRRSFYGFATVELVGKSLEDAYISHGDGSKIEKQNMKAPTEFVRVSSVGFSITSQAARG